MKVFVVSITGKPLMPTTPRRARIWLNTRRSRTVNREPFTIQLRFETADYTQPATVGVDTGSQTVGIAATKGEVVYQAEVHLRTDITGKLTHRRQYRRNRRSRKTRYRAARWANRRRRSDLLLPSLHTQAEVTVKAVRFAASFLPISGVKVEIGSVDTQRMQTPEISGISYPQGELQGYLLCEYLLEKRQRKCASCGAKGIPFQIEHLVPKSRGGSERASNVTLACEPCNVRKGHQTADEFGYPEMQAHARVPLRDAAHGSSIKTRVVQPLRDTLGVEQVAATYGYETKYKRMQVLGLLKSHINDAVAITCTIGELVKPLSMLYQLAVFPRGNYQMYNGKHSEQKVWAPRRVKGWKLYELVEAKGQIGTLEADGSREVLCSRGIHRQNNPGGGPKPVTSPCAVPAWLDTCHDSSIAKRRCARGPQPEVRGPRAHVFMDGLDEGMFPR